MGDGEPESGIVLRQHPKVAVFLREGGVGDIVPVDGHSASGYGPGTNQGGYEGGFTGAVGSDYGYELALAGREVDVVKNIGNEQLFDAQLFGCLYYGEGRLHLGRVEEPLQHEQWGGFLHEHAHGPADVMDGEEAAGDAHQGGGRIHRGECVGAHEGEQRQPEARDCGQGVVELRSDVHGVHAAVEAGHLVAVGFGLGAEPFAGVEEGEFRGRLLVDHLLTQVVCVAVVVVVLFPLFGQPAGAIKVHHQGGNERQYGKHGSPHVELDDRHEQGNSNRDRENDGCDRRGLHRQVPIGHHLQGLAHLFVGFGVRQPFRGQAGHLVVDGFAPHPGDIQPENVAKPGGNVLQ